jgi:hypothetical protein
LTGSGFVPHEKKNRPIAGNGFFKESYMSRSENRFEVIYKEGGGLSTSKKILLDTETGVKYLLIESGYGVALTPLLDRDGRPEVDPRYEYR